MHNIDERNGDDMDLKRVLTFVMTTIVCIFILQIAWPLIVIAVIFGALFLGYHYFKLRKAQKEMQAQADQMFDHFFTQDQPSNDVIDVDYTIVDEQVKNEESHY